MWLFDKFIFMISFAKTIFVGTEINSWEPSAIKLKKHDENEKKTTTTTARKVVIFVKKKHEWRR